MFGRAHEAVPPALANLSRDPAFALCEFVPKRRPNAPTVTTTSVCANGVIVEAPFDPLTDLVLYAVDEHLVATHLPALRYYFPAGITPTSPCDVIP